LADVSVLLLVSMALAAKNPINEICWKEHISALKRLALTESA
jgi:hypothetical protein